MTLRENPEENPHYSWKGVSKSFPEDQGTVRVLMEVQNRETSWHPQDVILPCAETVMKRLTSFGEQGKIVA